MNKNVQFALTMLALCCSGLANAATVTLVPSSPAIQAGATFTVDIVMAAEDAPGNTPGLIQGDLRVAWDTSALQYDGFAFVDSVEFIAPALGTGDVTFTFANAGKTSTIGTLTFTSVGAAGATTTIDLQHEFGFSTFNNFDPVVAGFDPQLIDADVTVVPIPAAAWLMLSALGVLGGVARRRAAA